VGFDYSVKLKPEGQLDDTSCWAACMSWWLSAMVLSSRRRGLPQGELLNLGRPYVNPDGGVGPRSLTRLAKLDAIRMDVRYVPPGSLLTDYASIDQPLLIVFNYPEAGGTHMNVIFDQKGKSVCCMEPYYPLTVDVKAKRTGKYFRRDLTFFNKSAEIGIGCLPAAESSVPPSE